MKALRTSAACIAIALSTGSVALLAQMRDNTEKQLTCNNDGRGDRGRHCEVRETSLPAIGRLTVDAGPNGGATIKGWLRAETLVRAKIETSGDNDGDAINLASRVNIEASGGQVRATGPENLNRRGWSVSYEIFTPQVTDLTVTTRNGGIAISDLRGQLHVETYNGGLQMKRVMGDVVGSTYNGGIDIEMAGRFWDGRQMELKTHNGGVNLAMPAQFNAHIQAETAMGELRSDFPAPPHTPDGNRNRHWDFSVGGGGAPIHITTANGGIHIKRTESQ